MAKELNISKYRALTRIFVLVSSLLFLSPQVFAFIYLSDSGDDNLVQYIYDERNQKRAHIQHKADGNLTTLYDYDAAGNLAQQQDAKGQLFGYEYDALNRRHIQNFPSAGDITSIVTTYDANGNLDVVTENKPNGVVEITDHDHDLLDRLEQKIQRGHVVSYTYDNNGNRLTVTSPGGTTTNTFDTRNRLDTVTTASGTTVYTYLPTGWTDIVTHANGTKVDYDYDSIGRPLKILNRAANDDVLSQFDYQYDLNGNRTQQIEIQNGFANAAERTRTTDYVYDDLDRLESFTHTQGTSTESHTYTFYPSYDRKTETVVKDGATLKSRTFTYDETNWIKTITEGAGTGGAITYIYDNNGNSTAKIDTTGEGPASTLFTYNSRNQLVGVAAGNTGSEVGRGAYHYNYQGMRIRHLGSARGDIEYVYDDKSIIDELGNGSTTQVAHYSYGDRLLSLTSGGAEQFYHYAALGTTANLTNSSGQNQIAYRLDPFGEITQQEGTSLNRQVFTGHEHDTETGLIYMKARFYDPAVGRFINQDTYLGESTTPPSLHRYLYAYGNPLVFVDLFGFDSTMFDFAKSDPADGENIKRFSFDQTDGSTHKSAGDGLQGYERSERSWIDNCLQSMGNNCDGAGFEAHLAASARAKDLAASLTQERVNLVARTNNDELAEITGDPYYFEYRKKMARDMELLGAGLTAASIFMPSRGGSVSKDLQILRKSDDALELAEETQKIGQSITRISTQGPRKSTLNVPVYETPYKPLTKAQRADLKTKLEARSLTREEYQQLEWDRRFVNRRATGVRRFWAEERARLRAGESGSRNWSPEQREAILAGKRPQFNGETIQGHHKHNALDHPQIADDPNNIYPATKAEHFERWHGGDWRNDTFGTPVNPAFLEEF